MKSFLKGYTVFENSKAILLCYATQEMNQRYIHTPQFTVRCKFILYTDIEGFLDCFVKKPSSMKQSKNKRYIKWKHNMQFSLKTNKQKAARHTCDLPTKSVSERAVSLGLRRPVCNSYSIPWWWLKREGIYRDKSLIFRGNASSIFQNRKIHLYLLQSVNNSQLLTS